MKTKKTILLLVVLLMAFTANLSAQQHLEAIAKECENRDDVTISIVENKGKNKVVSVTFKNVPELQNKIIEAFRLDKSNAEQVIEERKEKKVKELFYRFEDDQYQTSYIYDVSSSGKIEFTILRNPKKNRTR